MKSGFQEPRGYKFANGMQQQEQEQQHRAEATRANALAQAFEQARHWASNDANMPFFLDWAY
eukprot:1138272-Pelagomonas_calceolata.AAC.5